MKIYTMRFNHMIYLAGAEPVDFLSNSHSKVKEIELQETKVVIRHHDEALLDVHVPLFNVSYYSLERAKEMTSEPEVAAKPGRKAKV